MSMYLVSDDELNTIIRLRRQDVLKFLTEVQEQNPLASFEDLMNVARNFFAAQATQFDYLADYTREEIEYGLVEPEVEPEHEPEADELDGAAVAEYAEEPENVDPQTDAVEETAETESEETVQVVDDTFDLIEDGEDVDPEPAAVELADAEEPADVEAPEAVEEEPVAVTAEKAVELVDQKDDRANKISLRALQRELRQIDRP